MNWINYNDLYNDLLILIAKLPKIDGVVGIPRSGMIPASILSTMLNVKLGAFTESGIIWLNGGVRDISENVEKIFVIDDSIDKGTSIERAMIAINGIPRYKAIYGCVYLNPEYPYIEYYGRKLSQPRMFEWNFMNNERLAQAMVDIDGVLCRDILPEENHHDGRYQKFLEEVQPKYRMKYPIHSICSARAEKYRGTIEQWFSKHDIKYKNLYLLPDIIEGEEDGAQFKSKKYKESDCTLFIESSEYTAKRIAELSHKPVICTDTMELYDSP